MAMYEEFFDSKFLTCADLGKKEHTLTIEAVNDETFKDGSRKPTLFFRGRKKGMVLNKTNGGKLKAAYGSDMELWVGKSVVLYPDVVDYGGKPVDAIRILVPLPAAGEDPNDSIPF